jgi:urease accessory protein
MLTISERLQQPRAPDARLVLPFEVRSRSRFRAQLSDGQEVGVILPRGQILRDGDQLLSPDGRVIEIAAAPETVSIVRTADLRWLARAAYHLGNRHVALQIGEGWLRYSHDHVLDEMLQGLGLKVTVEQAPFEPEAGAYHSGPDSTDNQRATHTHSHDH